MKRLSASILTGIFFLLPACDPITDTVSLTEVSTLISMVKNLVDLTKEFDKGTQELKTNIIESTDAAATKIRATNDTREIAAATQTLSDQWTVINNSYIKLQEMLKRIGDSAQNYFKKLNNNNSFIKDAALKEQDMKQTTLLRQKWQDQYANVQNDMNKVDSLITQENDFKIFLTDVSARRQIAGFLDSLSYISTQATRIANDIKEFSKNVIRLFQQDNIPAYDNNSSPVTRDQPDLPATRTQPSLSPRQDTSSPAILDPHAQNPTATCKRIWAEHNLFKYGKKGMDVHANLEFYNCKGDNCFCEASIFSESGEKLRTNYPLSVSLQPRFDITDFNDFVIFIPYTELASEKGVYGYKIILNIFNNTRQSSPVKIGESEYLHMTYTVD